MFELLGIALLLAALLAFNSLASMMMVGLWRVAGSDISFSGPNEHVTATQREDARLSDIDIGIREDGNRAAELRDDSRRRQRVAENV